MSTHLCTIVFIKYREFKLSNCDLIFNFNDVKRLNKKNNVFFYIVDVNFFFVQIKNVINQSIFFCKNKRFDILTKYKKKNCYLINSKIRYLNVEFWIKKVLKLKVVVFVVFFDIISTLNFIALIALIMLIILNTLKIFVTLMTNKKYVTFIDIIVYNTSLIVQTIVAIAKNFFNF